MKAISYDLCGDDVRQRACSVARRAGHFAPTAVTVGDRDGVVEFVASGYRKRTTGQYVPNAYLRNFGWKNTYYQRAVCVVNLLDPRRGGPTGVESNAVFAT